MQRILLLAFVLMMNYPVFAQSFVIEDINTLSDHLTYKNSRDYASIYDNIDGTPYLKDEFVKGEVIINDSIRIEHVPLRYNIMNDKIEFRDNNEQVLEIALSEQTYQFSFDEHVFVHRTYLINGEKNEGILEELVDGHIKLFKKYSAEFKQATKAIGFQDAEPDRIERKNEIFLIAADDAIPSEIEAKKKKVFAALKPFQPDIEQYAKKEKLKPRSEEDLIQLIHYCNQTDN
jgi:hypothetical protein